MQYKHIFPFLILFFLFALSQQWLGESQLFLGEIKRVKKQGSLASSEITLIPASQLLQSTSLIDYSITNWHKTTQAKQNAPKVKPIVYTLVNLL